MGEAGSPLSRKRSGGHSSPSPGWGVRVSRRVQALIGSASRPQRAPATPGAGSSAQAASPGPGSGGASTENSVVPECEPPSAQKALFK